MSNIGGVSKGAGPIAGNKHASEKSTIANDTGVHTSVSAGLSDGLASKSSFDSESYGPTYDYGVNPLTGNANERIVKNPPESSAKKNGKSFDIC